MTEQVVVVRGEGAAPATPDSVELSLTVSALEDSPEAALARAAERSEGLGRVMDGAGADGLGLRLGSALSIREPSAADPTPRPTAMAFRAQPSNGDAEVQVGAGSLDVTAAVEVTFQLQT